MTLANADCKKQTAYIEILDIIEDTERCCKGGWISILADHGISSKPQVRGHRSRRLNVQTGVCHCIVSTLLDEETNKYMIQKGT